LTKAAKCNPCQENTVVHSRNFERRVRCLVWAESPLVVGEASSSIARTAHPIDESSAWADGGVPIHRQDPEMSSGKGGGGGDGSAASGSNIVSLVQQLKAGKMSKEELFDQLSR
jgi:hypothetical protein